MPLTPSFIVGPGVREAMQRLGDEPRGHEQYTHDPATGVVLFSLTHGRDALYRWTPGDGVRQLRFESAPASPAPLRVAQAPSPNHWKGRPLAPSVVVCHITDGGDPTGWFADPRSDVSAHFTVLRDGRVVQHVRLQDQAWSNGVVTAARLPTWCPPGVNPNACCVSIEHEGRPGDDLRPGFGCLSVTQFQATVALQAWLRESVPTLTHWTGHNLFDPRDRAHCPGPTFPWTALRQALGLPQDLPETGSEEPALSATLTAGLVVATTC